MLGDSVTGGDHSLRSRSTVREQSGYYFDPFNTFQFYTTSSNTYIQSCLSFSPLSTILVPLDTVGIACRVRDE
jgi:hypothetical protein